MAEIRGCGYGVADFGFAVRMEVWSVPKFQTIKLKPLKWLEFVHPTFFPRMNPWAIWWILLTGNAD